MPEPPAIPADADPLKNNIELIPEQADPFGSWIPEQVAPSMELFWFFSGHFKKPLSIVRWQENQNR
ncbi:hypothetical protein DN752_11325 [Echinicola strongylocentroti]|uniref:Uncharacterized protein n=1 Tax=Echinicola strongylocentroti TaxID=1795355 RepID=A0A2Z4IDN9_9BACT|nr:hypothetical protein DN752_02775 [Echinicola strongylocentroti]AWW29189.1 hypothetical protein DN752_02995 [Echinicola strongylocentroti]AWW30670.1 hypothetical protein DN752_11325 [Echinicola strongylocentroti]